MPHSTASPYSTRRALERARNDPERDFGALIDHAESRLRVLLHFRMHARLRAVCDPDDLLQEVWSEAARRLDRFEYRGPGSFHRWLAGILSNKLLHAARALPRVPSPETDATEQKSSGESGLFAALARTRSGVSRDAKRREREGRVRAVLEGLPEPFRRAILLRFYEGLSGREAALVERIDESTMSVRFEKALRACAARLREFDS
jgi:RNA polymerase sigma-70 factor (ECF subfamily)